MSPQVTHICKSHCATSSWIGKKMAFRSQLDTSAAFPRLSTLFCFSSIFWAAKQATCTSASVRMCHSGECAVTARSVSKATVQGQRQPLKVTFVSFWFEHSRNTDAFRQSSQCVGIIPGMKKKNQTLLKHRLRCSSKRLHYF